MARAIAVHKAWRDAIHGGCYLRFEAAEAGREAYGVVSRRGGPGAAGRRPDRSEPPCAFAPPLRLSACRRRARGGLRLALPAPEGAKLTTPALRALVGDGLILPGTALAEVGLQLPVLWPETALAITAEQA